MSTCKGLQRSYPDVAAFEEMHYELSRLLVSEIHVGAVVEVTSRRQPTCECKLPFTTPATQFLHVGASIGTVAQRGYGSTGVGAGAW